MNRDVSGHRSRLKERFRQDGSRSLGRHELLELLMCYAIPRKDVKPLAREMLIRFGSVSGVLSAEETVLREVPGLGENGITLLKLVRELGVECLKFENFSALHFDNPRKLSHYLQLVAGGNTEESLYILLLDREYALIDMIEFKGDRHMLDASSGEILFKVLRCRRGQQVVIAHNHPDGKTKPSKTDVANTIRLKELFQTVGVSLIDHFIICPEKCVSIMKTTGVQRG